MDLIPVYGKAPEEFHFSGRRIKRGLYQAGTGYCINADCNGGANILRKAVPDPWKRVTDFRFLAYPTRADFRGLSHLKQKTCIMYCHHKTYTKVIRRLHPPTVSL